MNNLTRKSINNTCAREISKVISIALLDLFLCVCFLVYVPIKCVVECGLIENALAVTILGIICAAGCFFSFVIIKTAAECVVDEWGIRNDDLRMIENEERFGIH